MIFGKVIFYILGVFAVNKDGDIGCQKMMELRSGEGILPWVS